MPRARIPADEMQRLKSPRECCILDAPPETTFDDLTALATRLTEIAAQVPGVVFQFELRPDGSSWFPCASEGLRKIYRVSPEEVQIGRFMNL